MPDWAFIDTEDSLDTENSITDEQQWLLTLDRLVISNKTNETFSLLHEVLKEIGFREHKSIPNLFHFYSKEMDDARMGIEIELNPFTPSVQRMNIMLDNQYLHKLVKEKEEDTKDENGVELNVLIKYVGYVAQEMTGLDLFSIFIPLCIVNQGWDNIETREYVRYDFMIAFKNDIREATLEGNSHIAPDGSFYQ